ncbi:guanylate kinase [Natronospira proteinivora]|uniref:Guanylate kinase n=1 Tax=Natronospira proteinivora TaxID=1807133 RepID=A0ABT1GAN6_9GAMM|nr:guanylate kinase [Natronospira proteinivora]MCP1727975.1 guanylate kinase [Natronospira proteinivora]
MSEAMERGNLWVVSAPSGAGKTSLVRELVAHEPRLSFSISYTTRPPREGEVNGRDYVFVDEDRFVAMIDAGEFLEHAQVFGNRYGTARGQVDRELAEGHDVLLEIDWQGARQVRTMMPEGRSIFVLPPSREELERRLRGRGTDSDGVIERRLREAHAELLQWSEFDYAVINDDFHRALADMQRIVAGEGSNLKASRPAVGELAERLLAETPE